ncbi:MAG: CHAT domain-containing protein [Deltaproteobacteria bacterium]|nr:CHAT domain-containing protein [Deltaproteobacteria bacterium]
MAPAGWVWLLLVGSGCATGAGAGRGLDLPVQATGRRAYLPRQITTYLADELDPVVDPEGENLYYVSNQGGNRDIWVRPLRGGLPIRLTRHSADDFDPAISSDGETIAFASHRLDAKGDLFLMGADGGEVRRLTDRRSGDKQPAWFPDSTRLAYTRTDGESLAIFVLDTSTGRAERLCERPGFDPAISPDGRWVLFTSMSAGSDGATVPCLWLHRMLDGREAPLHACIQPEGFGAWDEAGRNVVFSRFQDDTDGDGDVDLQDRPSLWHQSLLAWESDDPRIGAVVPLTAGTSSDITPFVQGGVIYYASRVEEDLDVWSVPASGALEPLSSSAQAHKRAESLEDEQASLFVLRRCAIQLQGEEGERCGLEVADRLLVAGRPAQARIVYEDLAARASTASIRDRATLGQVAAGLDEKIPPGLTPSQQAEREPQAQALLRSLDGVDACQGRRELVRADVLRRIGRWSEALETLGRALATEGVSDRTAARVRLLEAEILQVLGHASASLESCLEVLRKYGQQREEAIEAAERILQQVEGGDLLQEARGRVEQLQSLGRRWKGLPVLSAMVHVKVGDLHRAAGRTELARRAYLLTESRFGDEPEMASRALEALSAIAEKDGDLSQALDHANELLVRYKKHARIRARARRLIRRLAGELAEDLVLKGEAGMAIKVYRQLLEQDPDDVVAHRQLIALLASKSRAQEAVRIYEAMSAQRPGDDLALYLHGLTLTYDHPPSRLDEARQIIEQALAINAQLPFAHQTLGWIFEQQYRHQQQSDGLERAAESYQAALSLLDARSHPRSAADLLLNLGNTHFALGNHQKAYMYYKQREQTEVPFVVAERRLVFLEQYGRSAFLSGEMPDAIRAFSTAASLSLQLGRKERLPRLVASQAAAYQLHEQYDRAVSAFAQACELYREQERNDRLASCYRNVAFNLYKQGKPRQAIRAFRRAEQELSRLREGQRTDEKEVSVGLGGRASRAAFGFDRAGELNFLHTYEGRLFRDAGDIARAKESLSKKIKLLQQELKRSENRDLLLDLAVAMNHLAVLQHQLGKRVSAAALFKRAASLAVESSSTRGVLVNSLNRLALFLEGCRSPTVDELVAELEEQARALQSSPDAPDDLQVRLLGGLGIALLQRVDAREMTGSKSLEAKIRSRLDELDRDAADLRRAEQVLRQAHELALKQRGRSAVRLIALCGWNLAEALERLGEGKEAARLRQESIQLAEELMLLKVHWRLGQGEDQARRLLSLPPWLAGTDDNEAARRERDRLLENRVRVAAVAGDAESAFLRHEQLLARRRLEAISLDDLEVASDDDRHFLSGIRIRTQALARELDELEPELEAEERKLARARAAKALDDLVGFLARGGKPRPFLRSLIAGEEVALQKLVQSLEPGEGVLEVAALPERVVVFLVTRSGLRMTTKTIQAEVLRKLIRKLRTAAPAAELARGMLSRWIVGPFEEQLAKLDSLVVVADELDLPAGVLLLEGRELVRKMSVVHLYRASDLVGMRALRNLNLQRALWVGPAPSDAMVRGFKEAFGALGHIEPAKLGVELGEAGVVCWDVALQADPSRPMRSVLGPDRELGALGGLSLVDLTARPASSALWILAHADGLQGPMTPCALEVAMMGAGIPSLLVLPRGASDVRRSRLLLRIVDLLATEPPAGALALAAREALDRGLVWQEMIGISIRGDAGMGAQARRVHAGRELGSAVRQAMEAFKDKHWSRALTAFLKVRQHAVFLGQNAILPRIDQGIVQCAFQLGEYELAVDYERRILAQATAARDAKAEARARNFLGILLSKARHSREAIEELEKAVKAFEAMGQIPDAAQAQADLALTYDASARYPEALSAARQALQRFETAGDGEQVLRMLRMIGATYLKRLNMASTARTWFEKALAQAEKMASQTSAAAVCLDLARTGLAAGTYEAALDLADRAGKIFDQLADKPGRAESLLERAKVLWYLGEYQRAFVAQRAALDYADRAGDTRLGIMARSLGGLIAMNLGDLKAAEEEMQKALDAARKSGLRAEEAVQLNNLGIVARQRGDLAEALQRFEQAGRIDAELKSNLGRAYGLRHIGVVERMMGKSGQAARHLEEALELSRSVGDRFNEVKTLVGLAQLDLMCDRRQQAHAHARQAYESSLELGLREVTWRALRILGQVARQAGRREDARSHYEEAIDIVERMRASLKVEAFRSGFLDNKYDLYEDMIHLLLDLGEIEQALSFAERSRARGFLDLLANRHLQVGGAGNAALLGQVRKRREELVQLAEMLRRAEQTERAQAKERLEQAQREYRDLIERMRRENPDLSDFVEVRPLDAGELKRLLPSDVALLVYYVTDVDTLAWVVRADRVRARRLNLPREKLAKQIGTLRRLMESFSPADEELERLYAALVSPLEEELGDAAFVGVLPHDVLHYLPFAALKTGPEAYWSDRVDLFSVPSASVLAVLLRRQEERYGPAGGMLAVGNPDLGDPALDLPFAEREASSVGDEQPGSEVYLKDAATEARVMQQAGSAEYVHMACHGTFDAASPLFSALKLAAGEEQDGDLTAIEVFSMSLSARLVTLSACQTGLGELRCGDEIIGFNRSFLAAGAGGVVSSLWRVSDVATAVLMKRFYRYLHSEAPAVALGRAQKLVRRYFPHPAYWSGFVLVGSWR